MPPREENIDSLGTAVQHNFRRMLLLPSREEKIRCLGAESGGRVPQSRNQRGRPPRNYISVTFFLYTY